MASRRGRPPHPGPLTPAEANVLALISEGLHNDEIATRLGVSVNTVRFHVSNLLAKSGCPDRIALRSWKSEPVDGSQWRSAFGLLFPKPLAVLVGAGAGAVAVVALVFVVLSSPGEDSAPQAQETARAFRGAVVGILTRQAGGLVVTESSGSSFKLTSEMTFARLVGSQVFILGEVDGDSLTPAGGSPIGPHSRCAGVLAETGGIVSVGGSCRGMELSGVPIEILLALRSEKVTVTIVACTVSHGGRIDNPPIDGFGEERLHACAGAAAGGPNGEQ